MEEALNNNCFETWFQPQYNHNTGALIGAEALVRWISPERGIISPAVFIPIFERNGFVFLLDKYIWKQTCLYLRKWLDEGRNPLPVSVNVSRYDMFRVGFFEVITGLVEEYGIPKNLFRLEITESAFANSTEQLVGIVRKLQEFGLTVEIDDFGSGYSSFNTLKDVPADILKIDMRFLESNSNSERGGNILESIVRMTRWLNMSVIAEGVETKTQADYLCSIGCQNIQGYLYSKPIPADDFEKLLSGSRKETLSTEYELIDKMDPDLFWSPSSLETLVFNRFSGGAFVFEYYDGNIEILRINEKLPSVFKTELSKDEIINFNPLKLYSKREQSVIKKTIEYAVTGKEAQIAELRHFVHGKAEYVRFTIRMITKAKDAYLFYCYVENITAKHLAEKENAESMNQLKFLNDTSRDLIVYSHSEDAIHAMLEKILRYFSGERAYILEPNRLLTTISNSYELCADGIDSEIKTLQNIPISMIEPWRKQFSKNGYINISNVEKLDDDRQAEKEILAAQNIKSLIAVPMYRGEQFVGVLGIDNPKRHNSYVEHLMAVGDYMTILLARRDLTERVETASSLINFLPESSAIVLLEDNGNAKVMFATESIYSYFGLSLQEFITTFGEDAFCAVPADEVPALKKQLFSLKTEDGVKPFSVKMMSGGKTIIAEFAVRAFTSNSGRRYLSVWGVTRPREV